MRKPHGAERHAAFSCYHDDFKKVQHFDRKSAESFNHLKCSSVQCTYNCYFFGNSHN